MRPWLAIMVVAACGKGSVPTSTDGFVDAWKKAGLDTSAFAATTTPVGKDCVLGTVNKVDVLVCTFASEAEATAAKDAGLQWIGDTTGKVETKGVRLIVAADRRKADPNGKAINQIFKAGS